MSERIEYWSGNQTASEALTAGLIVTMDTGQFRAADTPQERPVGVVLHDCASGSIPVVVTGGVVNVDLASGQNPSAGEFIRTADATAAGKAAEATATADVDVSSGSPDVIFEWIIGTAVQDASASGGLVRCSIEPARINIYGGTA